MDHATMPLKLPSLDHLTTEELGQLRGRVMLVSREARKKATQIIGREPSLKKPWGRSLSMGNNTTHEERTEIQRELEQALLRVPEAYLAHAWANSLVALDTHVREELQRRTGSVNPKKKGTPPPPPPDEPKWVPAAKQAVHVHEYPKAPEPSKPKVEDDEGEALDLSGMFDGGDDSV